MAALAALQYIAQVEASTDAPAPSFHVQLKTRRPYFTCQHAGVSCKPAAPPGTAVDEDSEGAGQQLCPVHVQAVYDLHAQAASRQQAHQVSFYKASCCLVVENQTDHCPL